MTSNDEIKLCCVNRCPERAVTAESGSIGQWIIVLPYCEEHGRDARGGTPLGGVGLESSRILTASSPDSMPKVGGQLPGIG